MAALLFLPFGIRHIARDGTLEVYLLGPIANSRQIGFRRYFNDGAEPIEGAARMLSRLLGMHLIFRKPRSVRSLELNPLEQHSMEEMNAERLTDAELMEAVVCRDSDVMGAIYQRYESMLRVVVSSILHDEGETDDFLQKKDCRDF